MFGRVERGLTLEGGFTYDLYINEALLMTNKLVENDLLFLSFYCINNCVILPHHNNFISCLNSIEQHYKKFFAIAGEDYQPIPNRKTFLISQGLFILTLPTYKKLP